MSEKRTFQLICEKSPAHGEGTARIYRKRCLLSHIVVDEGDLPELIKGLMDVFGADAFHRVVMEQFYPLRTCTVEIPSLPANCGESPLKATYRIYSDHELMFKYSPGNPVVPLKDGDIVKIPSVISAEDRDRIQRKFTEAVEKGYGGQILIVPPGVKVEKVSPDPPKPEDHVHSSADDGCLQRVLETVKKDLEFAYWLENKIKDVTGSKRRASLSWLDDSPNAVTPAPKDGDVLETPPEADKEETWLDRSPLF